MLNFDWLGFLAAANRLRAHPRKCLLKLLVEEYACVTVCNFQDRAEGQLDIWERSVIAERCVVWAFRACAHRSVIELGYEY